MIDTEMVNWCSYHRQRRSKIFRRQQQQHVKGNFNGFKNGNQHRNLDSTTWVWNELFCSKNQTTKTHPWLPFSLEDGPSTLSRETKLTHTGCQTEEGKADAEIAPSEHGYQEDKKHPGRDTMSNLIESRWEERWKIHRKPRWNIGPLRCEQWRRA